MKRIWWKVPLYCCAAGWVSFQLMVRLLGRLAIVTLPDGTITSDNTIWMLLSGCVFAAVVLLGGMLIFRKMTRREVFLSATVMVVLNAIMGILSQINASFYPLIWAYICEWSSFVSQLLFRLNVNNWLSGIIVWAMPYVLFKDNCR